VLGGLLRQELGFDGVVVSDALDMKGASGVLGIPAAAAAALAAGCDLLCIGTENTAEQLDRIEAAILAAVDAGTLSVERLADAAKRVHDLAAGLMAETGSAPVPESERADSEPGFDSGRIVASFAVNDTAARWLAAAGDDFSVLRLDTVSNIAVGGAPWGPFAEAAANPDSSLAVAWRSRHLVARGIDEDSELVLPAAGAVLVIGKDNHRHAFIRDLVDLLRTQSRDVLVVDMGWPSDDLAYADIATYGASRLAGRCGSTWGSRMCEVMTVFAPAAIAARNGTSSRSRRVSSGTSTTGMARCESRAVSPWPGKCLGQAATPVDCSPRTQAAECSPTRTGSVPKLRTPITGLSGLELTSTSGAKVRVQPALRSCQPTRRPTSSVWSTSSMRPRMALPGYGEPEEK
jgi:hypothetical protein